MQGPEGSFGYDSYTRVGPRKKRKGKARTHAPAPSELLKHARKELLGHDGWSLACEEILNEAVRDACIEPREALCLGLGSPSSSRDARAQLVLLGCLCVSSHVDTVDVSVYDPVFTDADVQLLQTLGMRCIDPTLQGSAHSLSCPTILYMPHCDLGLYEAVIRANWSLDGLCNIVFLANRLGDYVDNNAASKLERESPCLLRLAPLLRCRPLPAPTAFRDAFNSLSVQHVRRSQLSLQDEAFWRLEPLLHNKTN